MTETIQTEATQAPIDNGKPAGPTDAPPGTAQGLPEGTIQLSRAMLDRVTRSLRDNPHFNDVLGAYLEGRGETIQYGLYLPALLLLKPQPGQGGT